jgi:fructose-1-phosphate kinase PfkB-like protein
LIRAGHKLGVKTSVDTEGEPLRLAVKAEPDVVTPNELEAEELVGHEFNGIDDRAAAVVEIARQGAGEAIMTVPDGCYGYVDDDGSRTLYRVAVPPLEAVSPIGSGDAFLAGYVASRYMDKGQVQALSFGVACGAESTQHIGAGVLEPGKVDRLLDSVQAERMHLPSGVV